MSGPTVTREQKIALWKILADGTWKTKKQILLDSCYVLSGSKLNDRAIRAICSAEPDKFLSSQLGYKLVRHATDDEINAAIADLRSRIKCLSERSEALERVLRERRQKPMTYYGTSEAEHDALNEDCR